MLHIEVVLAVLLSSFKFSPADKEVVWNVAGIQYPTVDRISRKAEMPLKVTAI